MDDDARADGGRAAEDELSHAVGQFSSWREVWQALYVASAGQAGCCRGVLQADALRAAGV